jgi:glutamine amidotransferase
MIALVSYGLGNIKAFLRVYKKLGIDARAVSSETELRQAEKIILPGVGAFDYAMRKLEQSGLRAVLDELVLDKKVPVIGICVGMQMMMDTSDEGQLPGLGWVTGRVQRFDAGRLGSHNPLPHMGWNTVYPGQDNPLFDGLPAESLFYFLHSFYCQPARAEANLASCHYPDEFCCAFKQDNVFGVQFHPEKSHHNGVRLLKNFAELPYA